MENIMHHKDKMTFIRSGFRISRFLNFSIACLAFNLISHAQTPEQGLVIEKTGSYSGNLSLTARDAIILKPGFSYTPSTGNAFTASISGNLVLPVGYIPNSSIIDISTRELDYNLPVGSIQGSLDVLPNGSASYTIPLNIPPGTAGMTPQVSISYNSMAGNSELGLGWGIGGLSAISRTGKSIYYDNEVSAVNLDASDRFALDGTRLLVKGQAAYGSDQSEYATEMESYSKIVAHGNIYGGPEWFEVTSKDGMILEYGRTTDSRIEPHPGTSVAPYLWRLNRQKDVHGNYIDYEYLEHYGNSVIKRIKYTGRENEEEPYNEIVFKYSERFDKSISFIAGKNVEQKLLLDRIEVFSEGNKVRDYSFVYYKEEFDKAFQTKLNQVTEYNSLGGVFNSLVINFQENTQPEEVSIDRLSSLMTGEDFTYSVADFNNDGLDDFIRSPNKADITNDDTWSLFINQGNNSFQSVAEISYPDFSTGILWFKKERGTKDSNYMDFNGDGYPDVVHKIEKKVGGDIEYTRLCVYDYNPANQNFDSPRIIYQSTDEEPKDFFFGDFDGDGTGDYFVNSASTILDNHRIKTIDFNGDGKTDIMALNKDQSAIEDACIIFNGSNLSDELYHGGFPTISHHILPGDFNGDGKTDILTYNQNFGWELSYSNSETWIGGNADGLEEASYSDSPPNVWVADVNGDGKSEVLFREPYLAHSPVEYNWVIFYSSESGFIPVDNLLLLLPPVLGGSETDLIVYPGDFDGDGNLEFIHNIISTIKINLSTEYKVYAPYMIEPHKDKRINLVCKVSNGLNQKQIIEYKYLSDPTIYQKYSLTQAGYVDFMAPLPVVSSVSREVTPNQFITSNYSYEGGKVHMGGKGFLGFSKFKMYSEQLNIRKTSASNLNLELIGMTPDYNLNQLYGGANVSLTEYEYHPKENSLLNPGICSVLNLKSTKITDYVNAKEAKTTYEYDDFGNITTQTEVTGTTISSPDLTSTSNMQYAAYNGTIPNRMTQQTVVRTYKNESPHTSTTNYEYYPNGSLKKVNNLQYTDKSQTVEYTYNSRGLKNKEILLAYGKPAINTYYFYDNRSRFCTQVKNMENMSVYKTYDPANGNVLSETDVNGKTSNYYYDGFGRLVKSVDYRGHEYTQTLNWVNDPNLPGAVYMSMSAGPGIPYSKTWYDLSGREIRSETESQGGVVFSNKGYTTKGNISWVSKPAYLNSSTLEYTIYTYDGYNRQATVESNGTTTQFSYSSSPRSITSLNQQSGQSVTKYFDAVGNVTKVSDNGGNVEYHYYSHGKLREIITGGHTVSMEYDPAGNQTKLIDPDAGTITYTYNALGQLVIQTDPGGTTSMTYDLAGRLETETNAEETITYTYHISPTTPHLYGLPASVNNGAGVSETYAYDSYGQLTGITETINGENFVYGYTYDGYGNVLTESYPNSITTRNTWDQKGFLEKISLSSNNFVLWQYVSEDKPGRINQYKRGSDLMTTLSYDNNNFPAGITTSRAGTTFQQLGMVFNSYTGNLSSRSDVLRGLTESFNYDNLDRLEQSQVAGLTALEMDYEANGNISYKSDAGDYAYDPLRTHAVTSVSSTEWPTPFPMEQQDITYTPFQSVKTITEGNNSLSIQYGPDRQRRRMVTDRDGLTTTTLYGRNYERVTSGSEVKHYHYIGSPTGLAAILINGQVYFPLSDHLGSITGLVSSTTYTLVEEYSYDPWGRRRNPADWSYENVPVPAYLTRGYTGHEHLDDFGLINMNGRVYDPLLGRFLSPDNYVQMPYGTQGFNRFGYCLNNPLKYTDPSGESIIAAILVGAILNSSFQILAGNVNNGKDFFWSLAVGGISGLVGAGVGQFVAGAVGNMGFAAGAITGSTAGFAGGFVGGAGNAWIGGADLFGGLQAGLVSGGIGFVTGGVIGGISGGVNAVRNGGTFWSGDGVILESSFPISATEEGFKFKNDDEMLSWLEGNEVNLEDFGVDKITAYENVNISNNRYEYYRGNDGLIYKLDTKTFTTTMKVGGVTQINGGPFSRTSNIYMSRIANLNSFTKVLNHELIHAYHISQGLYFRYGSSFTNYTERIAYDYSAKVGINSIQDALKWIPYPYERIMPPYLVPIQ